MDEDFRAQMRKLLRSRTKLAPVRLELELCGQRPVPNSISASAWT